MRSRIFLLFAVLAAAVPAQGDKRLTLEQTLRGGPRFTARTPRLSFGPEGRLVRVSEGVGRDAKTTWIDPGTGEPVEAPQASASPSTPRTRVSTRGGNVFVQPPKKEKPHQMTSSGDCEEPHLAPDAKRVSFVRGKNLVVMDVETKQEWAVTADGSDRMFYGVLDWVYQEEIYGRGNFQGHWWSPDGKHVAFLRLDQANVKSFTVIDHVPERKLADERAVKPEITSYPKAGDPNPIVGLGIANVEDRTVRWVDFESYDDGVLVVNVGWSPSGDRLVYQVQDRIQTWLDLNTADPVTGESKRLLRETSNTWVNVIDPPRWLADGSFLWSSERTGYQNVYRYSAAGEQLAHVTPVQWPVLSIMRVDEERGLMWFTGRGESAIDRQAFRVSLDGKGLVQLTDGPGSHRVTLSSSGDFLIDSVSSISSLPEVRICDATGKVVKKWQAAAPSTLAEYAVSPRELVSVPTRDGTLLDATVILPHNFDKEKRYPIWIDTYSGPNAPSVRNSWSVSTWHQFLQQNGLIVLQVNVRSASGRGQASTGACYKQLGVSELRDLEDAVRWVCDNRNGDARNVGINGWSYGGFMSAYALTHSKAFALGIAGAGVFDWQLYDTVYTERYMSTPQLNPEGYRASSVLKAAKDLHGHLVILHGTMDDNVHLQNAIRLIYELQIANKDFEMMLYPKSRHGVRMPQQRAQMRRIVWRAIQQHLLDDANQGG